MEPLLARDHKFLALAYKLSHKSNAPNFKIGAVVTRGSEILGIGFNDIVKTHPKSKTYGQHIHAEMSAIMDVRNRDDLRGATIYVARMSKRPLLAKPCKYCQALINEAGIRTVVYTDYDNYVKEKVS